MTATIANQLTLRAVDPVTSADWAALTSGPGSTLFHSPEWLRVVQETYDLPISACVVDDGGPVAGIAWAQISPLLGGRLVSLPFCDHAGPIAQTAEQANALVQHVRHIGRPWSLRSATSALHGLPMEQWVSRRALLPRLDLVGDEAVLWGRLSPMARRGVRKGQKSPIEIRAATDKTQLRDWYLLHLRLRKAKFGLLAQPYSFFERIWDTFVESGRGFLLLATLEGRVVAGTLYLLWGDTCYYKFNASESGSLPLRPNNLLLWQGMCEAKRLGCRTLDLGRTAPHQRGLRDFKRAFGATEEELLFASFNDAPAEKDAPEAAKLLQDLTGLFVQPSVPDSVTEQAGARLYRYFG